MNHRAFLISVLCFLLLVQSLSFSAMPVTAQSETTEENFTKYKITHDMQTDKTNIQLQARVTEAQEFDDFTLTWNIPESATITDVSTATSESVNISRSGSTIELTEEDGEKRNSETFYVNYTVSDGSVLQETQRFNISQYQLSLSAFSSAPSTVQLTFKNTSTEIANVIRYSNHSLHVKNHSVTADGVGPITITTNVKDDNGSVQTDDFVVYNKNISTITLNNSYALSTRGTGVIPQYKQVPVIIIDEKTYDEAFGELSAGRYKSGVIYLSNNQGNDTILPLLTHEYTHAITDRVQYSNHPRWFLEGTAQYTESIARKEVGRTQDSINEGEFWDYYSNNESWVLSKWDFQNTERSRFAYAYSEAIFKQYAIQESPQAIHQLHADMINGNIEVNETSTPGVLFGESWTGQVCQTDTKTETMDCIDETMAYTPPSDEPESYSTPFETDDPVQSVEIEQTEETTEETTQDQVTENTESTNSETKTEEEKQKLIDFIIELILSIIEWLIEFIKGLFS